MSEDKLSPYQKWKTNVGGTRPWDLINPKTEIVTEEIASKRLEICSGCPELISLTKQCKKCGCLMHLKTKLKAAVCPLGKW